jgi:riboflavin kinase/FMN adenylyltransferase
MLTYKINRNQKYPQLSGAVIALGSFDGVHRSHLKILQTGLRLAYKLHKPFGVITFSPIPQMFLYQAYHFILTTEQEKIDILRNLRIDFLGMIKFSEHLRNIEARQFILDYIVKTINPSAIVVGHDHHFGKEHKGNISLLKKLGKEFDFEVKVISSLKYHSAPIKSTRIRELIILGNVKRAQELLSRPYSIHGNVIKGKGIATSLGFPTLNIHIPNKEKLVSADGVYHIRATFIGKQYNGVMNIGFAPTIPDQFRAQQLRTLEVHLFNFKGSEDTSLNKPITVEFFDRLRPERKFDNLEQLKHQIAEDIKKVKGSIG